MKVILLQSFKVLLVLILPFVTLIRGAVFLHEQYELWPWPALAGGIIFSAALIFFYLLYIQRWIGQRYGGKPSFKKGHWLALFLVLVYCLPAVFYLSNNNAKHPEVRDEFTSLHPILRLGISTLVFLDGDLILTDGSRQPEDYRKMGLKTKAHSLHYKQSSGYAHAVDIRTKGRSEFRNFLIKTYFQGMGFNTLRHVGTDDHLHVSLMSHDRKGGI